MRRSRLRVNQRETVRLDLAPAQAAYLARPASRQQEQAHRRDADRVIRFPLAQDRAELRQIVRTEQPPARRTAIAGDAGARVSGGFGPMAPRDGSVEHGAQYVMTPMWNVPKPPGISVMWRGHCRLNDIALGATQKISDVGN